MKVVEKQSITEIIRIEDVNEDMYICSINGGYILKRINSVDKLYVWLSLNCNGGWKVESPQNLRMALVEGIKSFGGINAFQEQFEMIQYIRRMS